MSRINIVFIVNPIAGHGNGQSCIESIRKHLDRDRFDSRFEFTRSKGHARIIASEAAAGGADIVVAVGGDGTVNEIASALVGTGTALAIIPRGSGNGLAFHLGIPHSISGAVKVINAANIETIDSATVNGRRFFCTCGVGYDAKVAFDYANAGRRGLATYTAKAVEDWFKYVPQAYRITTDNCQLTTDALLITCGNANQWGNNFHITPLASLKDGLLDVSIVHRPSIPQAIGMSARLLRYDFNKCSNVTSLKTTRITIEREAASEAHFDGEPIIEDRCLEICLDPASLNVVSKPGKSI